MQLLRAKSIAPIIVNGIFLIALNIILMSIVGYLTLDSNANINSSIGGYLLSFFLPFFIVLKTQQMTAIERMLKFGFGYIAYLVIILFVLRIPDILFTGLGPCLIISLGVLFYGEDFLHKTELK